MSNVKSSEEVKSQYISCMGRDLGDLFYALYKEVVWVHAKWGEYKILYGSGPETVEFLNTKAGFFFKLVQDSWWDDVVLHIARLTDTKKMRGKENLSLMQLPEKIANASLRARVDDLLKDCQSACASIKDRRNRRLAHRDLMNSREPDVFPLEGISRKNIEDVLGTVAEIMNAIDGYYRDATVLYKHFTPISGSKTLLAHLRRADKRSANAH